MAVVIYNDYLIFAVAQHDRLAHHWCVSVDLSSRDAGHPISSFTTRHEFETQAQAENCGLNLGRAWIDQRVKHLHRVQRGASVLTHSEGGKPDQREHQPPFSSSIQLESLRSEVREFAERIEETLRHNETKKKDRWMKLSAEELVHEVLDNTSALLMTNYNDESQRASLQATCLDLATLALVIRRKSKHQKEG